MTASKNRSYVKIFLPASGIKYMYNTTTKLAAPPGRTPKENPDLCTFLSPHHQTRRKIFLFPREKNAIFI
jgi:hypothetical protein